MRIVITGHRGYIGPVLIRHLRACLPGVHLTGIDTGYFSFEPDPAPSVDIDHRLDIRDVTARHLVGADAVIHLAAISNDPMGREFEDATMEVNYQATVDLARMARTSGVSSFVFASSCSVYGAGDGAPRGEESALDPLTAYARSKVRAEEGLASLSRPGFAVTALRFATACGMSPHLRLDLVLNDFVAAALRTGSIFVLSDGRPWRPLIHVADMSRALGWGARRGDAPPFLIVNAGSNEWNYQVRDLAEAVAAEIPGSIVEVNPAAQPDRRSYKVDFSRFRGLAPQHVPRLTLQEAIQDIRDGIGDLDGRGAMVEPPLIRLQALRDLVNAGRVGRDLRWMDP